MSTIINKKLISDLKQKFRIEEPDSKMCSVQKNKFSDNATIAISSGRSVPPSTVARNFSKLIQSVHQ